MTEKFEMEVELKSPPEALWNTIKDLNFVYPKLFPHLYDSIEILEGDGRSAGTIRRVNFKDEIYGQSYKSKIESVDEENKTVFYRVLDDIFQKFYKSCDDYITVKPLEGSGGSWLVWTCIVENAIEEAPSVGRLKDTMTGIFHKLDDYTLSKIKS